MIINYRKATKDVAPEPANTAEDAEKGAEHALLDVEIATVPEKKKRWSCVPAIRYTENGEIMDEDDYADRVQRLSWITFGFILVAFIAINAGLLVGWRPPKEPWME